MITIPIIPLIVSKPSRSRAARVDRRENVKLWGFYWIGSGNDVLIVLFCFALGLLELVMCCSME